MKGGRTDMGQLVEDGVTLCSEGFQPCSSASLGKILQTHN